MKHDYTDEEIKEAENEAFRRMPIAKGHEWVKAFLDALPTRSAEPAEIAALKAALAESEKQFQAKVDEIARLLDECDKDQGILKACLSVMPFGNIKTHTFENLPGRIADLASEIASLSLENERLEAELAALRQSTQSAQPILADDGRSLGQVAFDAGNAVQKIKFPKQEIETWEESAEMHEMIEAAAQAVAAVVEARMIRRMEAVPVGAIARPYEIATQFHASECGLEAVRSRLIAAAKGEGQAQPIVVNEPPKDEGQPDLSGESEKQADPAWIPHDGGPCPLKDEEVEEWGEKRSIGGEYVWKFPPSQAAGWSPKIRNSITHYRVLRWKPGFGPEAKAEPAQVQPTTSPGWTPAVGDVVRSTPEMALGGQMYWRDLALKIARVWWKCHNIGASLQHGDLDKDIAFSIVCERHGGRVFHGDTPENAWNKAEEWLLSPDRENFPTACLTPSRP